jgi:hypothetical protein
MELEILRDVTLRGSKALAPGVVRRHLGLLPATHLNAVAKNPVVNNFKASDPRPLPLFFFIVSDPGLDVSAD